MAGSALALGSGLNAIIVAQGNVHDATLIRRHGTQLHAAVLLRRLGSGVAGNGLKLLALAVLVTSTSTITG